jgi:hypothetical protein
MELRGVVHALSEYKPQFADVVTAPVDSTLDFDDRLLATFGDCVAGLLDTFGNVFTISAEDGIGELVMTAKVVTDKASPITTNARTTKVVFDSFRFEPTT